MTQAEAHEQEAAAVEDREHDRYGCAPHSNDASEWHPGSWTDEVFPS